jgi:penicillin G amidase
VHDADRAMLQVTWNENVIAVDDRGNIGYWHPGLHPLRPKGFDERLPYPGTGEAEWRGFLPRRRTPYAINPRQGYLFQWNNVPSLGWTAGDAVATERLSGNYHRARLLKLLVGRAVKKPSYEVSKGINRVSGTIAQQYPFFRRHLRRAVRGTRGPTRQVFQTLLEWNGNYHHTRSDGTVSPGVAVWEEFKDQAERIALWSLAKRAPGPGTLALAGNPGTSHAFDISNGEAYALRTLRLRALRLAAERTHEKLAGRFGSPNPDNWREPRKMYDVSAQGAASTPELPFFDRGTWEQSVGLGP